MKQPMAVTWHCDRCAVKNVIVYDQPVTRQKAYVDVMNAHGLPIQKIEQPGVFQHMQAVHFNVRHACRANTQQQLFE